MTLTVYKLVCSKMRWVKEYKSTEAKEKKKKLGENPPSEPILG